MTREWQIVPLLPFLWVMPQTAFTLLWKNAGVRKSIEFGVRESKFVSLCLPFTSCMTMLIIYILWTSIFLSVKWVPLMSPAFSISSATALSCMDWAVARNLRSTMPRFLESSPVGYRPSGELWMLTFPPHPGFTASAKHSDCLPGPEPVLELSMHDWIPS